MADKLSRSAQTPDLLASAQPHPPLTSLRDEIDRLFDSFFPAAFGRSLLDLDGRAFRALGDVGSVDVRQCADRYEIAADLPGVDRKDVAVTVTDNVLSIQGEAGVEHTDNKEGRTFTSFLRLFRLPKDADAGAIGARFVKGVLTVTVPRHEAEPSDHDVEVKGH